MKALPDARGLREMRWQDLPAVIALERRAYPDTAWNEATWWAELAGRPDRTYVVHLGRDNDTTEQEPKIIGYAGVSVTGELGDVMTITVDEARRGAGLGAELLSALHEAARSRGARQILLEVRADNEAAQRLYTRHGYQQISRRRGYYQPRGVDALVMRADLASAQGLEHDGDEAMT